MKYHAKLLIYALMATSGVASADISVVPVSGCGSHSPAVIVWNAIDLAWEVSINATVSCDTSYTIAVQADKPLDSIKYINITANRAPTVTSGYLIVSIAPQSYPSDTIPKLGSVQRVSGNAPIFVSATNIGQLGFGPSSPATISAGNIGTISVLKNSGVTGYTGDVFASISATAASPLQGNITAVLCDGNLHGSVAATNWIGTLKSLSDIGSASSSVSVSFGNYLQLMEGNVIYTSMASTSGFLKRLETRVGDLAGTLSVHRIDTDGSPGTPGVYVAGDLDADLTVSNTVYHPIAIGGDLASAGSIDIGVNQSTAAPITIDGSLLGSISIGSGGLNGQVIVNAADSSETWTGTVTVGSTTLATAPHYSQLSALLGGGAVGLVPFSLHGPDSSPAHGTTVSASIPSARVRHYGPVTFVSGMPVTVQRQAQTVPPGSWVDVTSQFDAAVSGSNARDLIVTPKTGYAFTAPAKYRITPGHDSDELLCDDVVGNPLVDDYTYEFTVQPEIYDFSGGGDFGPEDLVEWLIDPRDITFDDSADVIDWDILLQALADTGQ